MGWIYTLVPKLFTKTIKQFIDTVTRAFSFLKVPSPFSAGHCIVKLCEVPLAALLSSVSRGCVTLSIAAAAGRSAQVSSAGAARPSGQC